MERESWTRLCLRRWSLRPNLPHYPIAHSQTHASSKAAGGKRRAIAAKVKGPGDYNGGEWGEQLEKHHPSDLEDKRAWLRFSFGFRRSGANTVRSRPDEAE